MVTKMGTFEVFKAVNGNFYFRLKAANGEIIAQSEGYASKQGALNGVQAVKQYAPGARVVEV